MEEPDMHQIRACSRRNGHWRNGLWAHERQLVCCRWLAAVAGSAYDRTALPIGKLVDVRLGNFIQ